MDHPNFWALRQGHVLDATGCAGLEGLHVVVSQSCDVVQPKRELLQLAPLVQLEDADLRRGALGKANPRYALVLSGVTPQFADLAKIFSIEKATVLDAPVFNDAAFSGELDARDFGLAIARWFGRFAFPDEVQPWLAPAQELIRAKYNRPTSVLGKVLHEIAEIRVGAASWSKLPIDLTLHVVVKAGSMPSVPEDADMSKVGTVPEDLNDVCDAILIATDPLRRSVLWAAFAEALAARCTPKGRMADDKAVLEAVESISGEASADDEFPLTKVRRSEQLDIDFLSDPAPY